MLFKDQLKREIALTNYPKRMVSLVPSQTELLYHLGLDDEVVGLTKFCVHPPQWFNHKTRIGGTKNVDIEKIKSLQPDLIIANKEENIRQEIEALAKDFPVWVSDVTNLEEALAMMESIGTITNKQAAAKELISSLQENFTQLDTQKLNNIRTGYLIWREPYMTVGGDTFIHDMLSKAGCKNIFEADKRYPSITIHQLEQANCELLLLSSEPYPFQQKHIDELRNQLPDTKILLVDGELFSWYGSRLLYSVDYFQALQKKIAAMQYIR